MLFKFFSKSIRSFGIFFIFFFSIFCIFSSVFMREIDTNPFFTQFLDFTISFDNRFYDYRMKKQIDPKRKSKDIALVKIDDYSLEKIGLWPIPRNLHADMIKKLKGFGAKVIGLDILYPEKSLSCDANSPDASLAKAFKDFQDSPENRIFLGFTRGTNEKDSLKEVPDVMFMSDNVNTFSGPGVHLSESSIGKYTFPIEEFVNSGVGLASISAEEDPDGIFRHYQIVLNVDEFYLGSLGYNTWKSFVGNVNAINIDNNLTGTLSVGQKFLEINTRGEIKIRYFGGLNNFTNVSLYDLLQADPNDQSMHKAFNNKIVFVGSTAQGAHDMRSSPIDSKMPGVLGHLNVANMLLTEYFFKPENESIKFTLIILFLGMTILLLGQKMGSAVLDLIVVHLVLFGAYAADYYYFLPEGYELKLLYCFFCFIGSYSWTTFLNFSEASQEKKQIKGTFARYVAPTIVDEMLKDPDKLHVGGFKKDITCLFSDVRDFTSISEGLTAAELAQSLNMYMGKMTDIVFETKGTLDKYIGDAIVAFWGAPLDIGNHAERAVEGAIKMIELLPSINEEFRRLGRPEFYVGVGINSGECNVGNMGSDRIFSYTALGDNMNLGSRLEGLCKYYGTQILISEYTLQRLDRTKFKVRPIDKVIVKGRTTPVAIFEVLHSQHYMSSNNEDFVLYESAWQLFQKRNFKAALEIYLQLLSHKEDDKAVLRLRDLSLKYLQSPELADEEFDITKMTEK